ncbi:MAG: helix-turn-helix transcriptional regulator [Firmicutes bacterium]|nr:helix-turn-helix transcriptional regulator [Bacillota bacterium]
MDQIKIGKYIAEKRKALGMTQVELAEKLGMSNKSVSKWERGVCLPDVSVYMDLCEALGISLNEFLAGEDIEPVDREKKSEENIISVTKEGNRRSKKLRKTAVIMGLMIIILAAGMLTFLVKEGYLINNYLKSYDIDSSISQTAKTVMPFGNVQLFEFSCDKSFKEIEVTIYKKDDGRMRNKPIGSVEFPLAYDGMPREKTTGKGTLAITFDEYKLTVACMGGAYKLDLRDVIEGIEIKGALYHYGFAGTRKLIPGKKMVLYALDYGYDGAQVEPYATDNDYEAPRIIPYEDPDDLIEDPQGALEGYNDVVFVTVTFN